MSPTPDRLAAALADRYCIERELGQGGMATVYLAEDIKHHRKVAIKVLKPELAAVLGADRFVQEITTTAALQHPHILPLFDSGESDGFLWYAMPYIQGETLRDKLDRETQLGVDEAVRITTDVADALHYAHRHGVIHRDIKPENILLHDGRPMVADFGIALALSAAAGGRMTETGLSLGTPHYMSPEQATAEKEISARSDIYSLGSVCYEMLAGQPPHLGGSAQQIIMKIVTEEAVPVSQHRKSVPHNVAAAVAKSLEKLPADRFESARAFADALTNSAFTVAGLAGAALPSAGQARGRRTMALVGMGALILGVVLTRLVWRQPEPARTARLGLEFPVAQQPLFNLFSTVSGRPILAQPADGSGLLYWMADSASGRRLAFRSWDRLAVTPLPPDERGVCCTAFSPSGDSIAYLGTPHIVRVVPRVGGIPRTVADSGLTSVTDFSSGLDWGPDGRLYASGLDGLVRIDPHGGPAERVSTLDATRGDAQHVWPAVLPGAAGALLTVIPAVGSTDPARAQIGVADFSTGTVEILTQGTRAIYAPPGYLIVAKANGGLWAAPFDVRSRTLTGAERALPDTVMGVDFSLSAAGTLVYTKRITQSYEMVWVDRAGVVRPVGAGFTGMTLATPALSPEGTRVVVTVTGADGTSHLVVVPTDGGQGSRLTFDGTRNMRASWRPGTGAITFSSDGANGGLQRIVERNADGSGGTRAVATHDPRGVFGHTWSSDGVWLVFRTDNQEAGNADIMGIRPGIDTVARPLVTTAGEDLAPAVSPDSRWLAYSSDEEGSQEVYVRPFPETAGGKWKVSTAGGKDPAWSRDGRELFYVDVADNMVSVPIRPGSTFAWGVQKVLFPASGYLHNIYGRNYDVSPDGSRFVMLRGETGSTPHVVVVFDFLKELQQIMEP